MKKILYYILLIAVFSACESQLDITPKGKTVLGTVADLETLLNQTYSIGGGPVEDLGVICNESYSYMKNVSELLANKNLGEGARTCDFSVQLYVLAECVASRLDEFLCGHRQPLRCKFACQPAGGVALAGVRVYSCYECYLAHFFFLAGASSAKWLGKVSSTGLCVMA